EAGPVVDGDAFACARPREVRHSRVNRAACCGTPGSITQQRGDSRRRTTWRTGIRSQPVAEQPMPRPVPDVLVDLAGLTEAAQRLCRSQPDGLSVLPMLLGVELDPRQRLPFVAGELT